MAFTPFTQFRWRAGARVLLCWLLAGGGVMARAADVVPQFSNRSWYRSSGLPGNEITSFCLDQTGYLWIGTWNGLARFDGSRFLTYDYRPPGHVGATGFVAIVADPAGEGLWLAPAPGGLVRLLGGRFEPVSLPKNYGQQRIARLFVAADGVLWIAFEGGDVMRLHGDQPEVFTAADGLGPMRSTQLASDGTGRVWLANGPHLAWYEAGKLHPVEMEESTDDLRITSARQDGPWVLTRGWLHKIVDGKPGLTVQVNSNFNGRSVQALLEDGSGAIWFGSRARGLRRLTPADRKSDLVLETPEDVGVLLADSSGDIWVGSNGGGLVRVRRGAVRRFDKSQGLLESHTLGVCEDNAGTIWIANRDGGVAYLNEQGRVRTLAAPRMRNTFSARSLAPVGPSGVYVTTSYGLLRAEQTGLVATDASGAPPQPPKHGEMRATSLARNGDLWVDLEPGRLGRLREGAWQVFTKEEGMVGGAIQVITEDPRGRILVGTEQGSLQALEGERFAPVALSLPEGAGAIQSVHFDRAGNGWIGTSGAGLARLGSPGRTLDKRHGLPSNNITQVISDDLGELWFGSPDGIFHVRREDVDKFFAGQSSSVDATTLSADDGLGETNCAIKHQPSVWKSRDGVLWFATRQGVVAIDPQRGQAARTPLAVKIDAVRAGEQTWPGVGSVRVPALTRTLDFDYSVLCLSSPERVRARVKLKGYEDDWTDADPRDPVRYARLPPGEYTFMVEARLAGAPGTSASVNLPIVVAAAWWQTLWFKIALVGLVLLLGGLVARFWSHRRLRARLAQLESASVVERERARIAQNIHDELGSGLTRISLLTQSAEVADGRAQLDRIYGTVSDLTQAMDEIVWAVNPKNDNLEGLANYVVEFAQGFLTDAGIRCRVALPDFFPANPLTTQGRHHLFMACKEALNNVVKHAQATEVSLQIEAGDDRIRVVIADNGRGHQSAAAGSRTGNGLANMRARLAALSGTCEIVQDHGTTVVFSAPLPPAPEHS